MDSRRDEIRRAATTLFLERGYAGTSTDAIVERSGGSKETVYAHFGSKLGLLEAVVQHAAAIPVATLRDSLLDPLQPLRELQRIGIAFLTALAGLDSMALIRLMVAESERIPAIRSVFLHYGPKQAEAAIAEFLDRCKEAGTLDVADTAPYAEAFSALLLAPLLGTLVSAQPLSERAISDHVERLIPLFARLCPSRDREADPPLCAQRKEGHLT